MNKENEESDESDTRDGRMNMIRALEGMSNEGVHVARELRLMANAQAPYFDFVDVSPMARNIWRAAADLLDQCSGGENADNKLRSARKCQNTSHKSNNDNDGGNGGSRASS